MAESQTVLNARNTFQNVRGNGEPQDINGKNPQGKGEENEERISQKLRETFTTRGGSTYLKVRSPVSQTLKNFQYISKYEDHC